MREDETKVMNENEVKLTKNEEECCGEKESNNVKKYWWTIFSTIIVLAFATRFHRVDLPTHVCWDETHFGKMGSWYINRTFFLDVHPPLGKMLIGLSGYLTGYDGKFAFIDPGDKYLETNYLGMRSFCTFMGTMIIPFCFIIVWEMTRSLTAATLSSSLILLDVGVLTISQYILLDPIMIFFIMAAVMGLSKFNSAKDVAFSLRWWSWLTFTGAMMACAISVKFVGLFVVIYIGFHTIRDLWDIMGDVSKPLSETVKQLCARAFCLILLPFFIYVSIFYVHFAVLNRSGPGDVHFSSAFQSQLIGNSVRNASSPRDVAYGAVITIKNSSPGGGYLHSHTFPYPKGIGVQQQQVTTYVPKDFNNDFRIKRFIDDSLVNFTMIRYVKSGDLVRLEHHNTAKNLHSHREDAPLSKKHYQVTAYGQNGVGDENDAWRVEIIDGQVGDVLKIVWDKIRLVHNRLGCVLCATNRAQLPLWGFGQNEVSCSPNPREKDSIWNIEGNLFSKLPTINATDLAPSFFSKFVESHRVMFMTNAGIKPHEYEDSSQPWHWPFNYQGIIFSGGDEQTHRVYLLGNPVIWWGNLVFLVLFLVVYVGNSVREQRGVIEPTHIKERKQRMTSAGGWLFIAWALHYVPFWMMTRILYYHHYFPAVIFSSLLTGVILDYLLASIPQHTTEKLSNSLYHWCLGAVISAYVYSFYLFAPLSYGMVGPHAWKTNSSMYGLKWMTSWDF